MNPDPAKRREILTKLKRRIEQAEAGMPDASISMTGEELARYKKYYWDADVVIGEFAIREIK